MKGQHILEYSIEGLLHSRKMHSKIDFFHLVSYIHFFDASGIRYNFLSAYRILLEFNIIKKILPIHGVEGFHI